MNNITYHLSSPIVYALGWTLFHALWQGFALVLSTALVLHLLRNRSSELRYRIGVLALFTQLVTSVGTYLWHYKPTIPVSPSPTSLPMRSFAIQWQTVSQTLPWHKQMQLFLDEHLYQFVLIYLIGVVLFGVRLTGGWLYLQHLNRTATQSASDRLITLTNKLRSTLAIRSLVRVRESARIAVPMVVGTIKPVLLLPIGLMTNLSMQEVEAVLAHELAHIKRHDYAVNLLQSVMEVLYFFHPALWWLSARVREEREHCCDDLAVRACGGNGRILAQALAHVEELRLAQTSLTPSLAMALTSKRQLLLQRVRRMLGVPTQPVVSNRRLTGLTLATLLLISVSVYAVQQQPKPSKSKPAKITRRHKIDNNSEYGMADDKNVSYIIWKGQKLPASRVSRLQQELNKIEKGQLSLDNVSSTDREILETILDKNNGFETGMDALGEGLSHIDTDNIVVSAMNDIDMPKTLAEINKIEFDQVINEAVSSVAHLQPLSDSLSRLRSLHRNQIDSLSHLMALQSKQMESLHRQTEKLQFPIEEFGRSQEMLEWKKQRLMEEREKILEKREQMMHNDRNGKIDPASVEKQLELLEPQIKKQEQGIEELNKQLEEAQSKLETARQPMQKFEKEMAQISQQMEELSREMNKYNDEISLVREPMIEYEMDLRYAPKVYRTPRATKSIRGRAVIAPMPPTPPAAVTIPAAPSVRSIPAPKPAPAAVPVPPAAVKKVKVAPDPARIK